MHSTLQRESWRQGHRSLLCAAEPLEQGLATPTALFALQSLGRATSSGSRWVRSPTEKWANSSADEEAGEEALCRLWGTRAQRGTARLWGCSRGGLREDPGSPAPAILLSTQGKKAGTLDCVPELPVPVAVPSRPTLFGTPGCLGPCSAGAGRRAAATVTGAPSVQWPGLRPAPGPRCARQSAATLRFKCAQGRGSLPRRQRPPPRAPYSRGVCASVCERGPGRGPRGGGFGHGHSWLSLRRL